MSRKIRSLPRVNEKISKSITGNNISRDIPRLPQQRGNNIKYTQEHYNPTPFKKQSRDIPFSVTYYEPTEDIPPSFYEQNTIHPYVNSEGNSQTLEGFQLPIDPPGNNQDKESLIFNTKFILIYALVFSIALALNEVSVSVFKSFPKSQHIISKVTYVVILFGVTVLIAYLLKSRVNVPQVG